MHPINTIICVARRGLTLTGRGLRHVRRNLVIYLGAAVATIVALAPTAGAASSASPRLSRVRLGPGSAWRLNLSQAPASLQAAARRTLGTRKASLGTASQQAKLTASDGAANDIFGDSVAISGSTAVVGAPGHGAGAAYVFVRSGKTWSLQAELSPKHIPSYPPGFGWSVAIYGSTVVVGAFSEKMNVGAAYVFARSGTTWSQQAKLTASRASLGAQCITANSCYFGWSVALYKSTAVIGAPGANNKGAAYVFARSGKAWKQQAKLTAKHGEAGDGFGAAVAVSGSTAMVGDLNTSTSAPPDRGAAYVFVRSGTKWSRQAKLTASDGTPFDFFGSSIGLDKSTALIQGGSGAYVFVRSGATWSQQAELTPSTCCSSVAISGSTAVLGAGSVNSNTGAAYVYKRSGTTWSPQPELTASDGAPGDCFACGSTGGAVAISGSTAVIGAMGKNSGTGAAYVFAGL